MKDLNYTGDLLRIVLSREETLSTSLIAMVLAGLIVTGLIAGLGVLGLFLGCWERYWGRPELKILKSEKGESGFAFHFRWNGPKVRVQYNTVKLKLFNPFGSPSHVEVAQSFPKMAESFAKDLEMGPAMGPLLQAKGLEKAQIQVELSSLEGEGYLKEFKALPFIEMMKTAKTTVRDVEEEQFSSTLSSSENFWIVSRDFIADTVPGKGAQVALPTNPAFAAFFQGIGSGKEGAEASVQENFSISKVWIEDGCIVCNACEDIYPEVFKVVADGCDIIPGHPIDDGIKIEEAAEACPVEIIKFTKVS